jgi:CubicO group peptidase (beta-lactamase class C family)
MHAGLIGARVALVALLLLGSACDTDDPEPPAEPSAQPLEAFEPADVPDGSSGSLVATVDGEVVTCLGWGQAHRETGAAASCETVYDIGSVSKQFTAAAVVKLQMQGRLRVTDPIGRFFDGVPVDKRAITVRHLLTHTAGLVEALGDDYEPLTRRAMVSGALASELRTRPGTRYRYSNVGYSLLAAIIEKTSGLGYEEYLAQELFAPAGMAQTGYVLPQWDPSDVAVEYDAQDRPQGRPYDHPWAADGPYWNLRGNGGLLSTAHDMGQWLLALESDRVLDERARLELFRPRVLEEPGGETHYAYGWVVAETPLGTVNWHNGGNGWAYAELGQLPESGAGVFWATNHYRSSAGGWNLDRLRPSLTERVAGRLVDAR